MSTKPPIPQILVLARELKEYVDYVEAQMKALQAEAHEAFDGVLALAETLTGEQKVQLVRAMGFRPVGDDHQDDCIRRTHGSGFRCGCVPPATMWSQPQDVDVFRKETWNDRLELAHKWSREGSHGREKEEE